MTIKEVKEVIEVLRKQGNSDEDISMSFYLMYRDNKIDKNQFVALLAVLNYSLPKFFGDMDESEQIKFFMKEYQ